MFRVDIESFVSIEVVERCVGNIPAPLQAAFCLKGHPLRALTDRQSRSEPFARFGNSAARTNHVASAAGMSRAVAKSDRQA